MAHHVFPVRVYYEDTDHSGVVYHANYLKYFERAREHLLGPDELVRLLEEDGVGFVVVKASLRYRDGARFGDVIEIRSTAKQGSPYRAVFVQEAWRPGGTKPAVEAEIELCTVNRDGRLVKLPDGVVARVQALLAGA